MSKWQEFHSQYSPVEINKPNTKGGNLRGDWYRDSGTNKMWINGAPLSKYAKKYNNFSTEDDVLNFFRDVILKDMQAASPAQKEEIKNYLQKTFHQGGFSRPVSAPFAMSMTEYSQELQSNVFYATISDNDMNIISINIQTTPNGFKVQETTEIISLVGSPNTSGELMAMATSKPSGEKTDDDQYTIYPDAGKEYVVKLQGTIDVDFTKSTTDPTITVESNTISYGNKAIQKRLDHRRLGQMIVDFFRNILGLNKVQDLSDKIAEKNELVINENDEEGYKSAQCI
ncbi:MAG: hypothetical protein QM652_09675 [Legionella sp.]|uniref:hypothetical protein n=1 Tax=Legionella sp. TaxID=459 RepID=UPI0039E28800